MNYFCTWSVQNYLYGCGKADFQPEEAEGATGAAHARANMNLENLLGEQGWARRFILPRADSSIFCWTTAGTCPRARTRAGSAR